MPTYESFIIRFGPRQGRSFQTLVDSQAGHDEGTFEIPFTDEKLATLGADIGHGVRGTATTPPPRRHAGPPRPGDLEAIDSAGSVERQEARRGLTLKEAGGRLFRELFRGRVAALFRANVEGARRQGHDLCVRLCFGSRHPHLPQLTNLPWEALYDETRGVFLSQLRSSPIVRYLELPQPEAPGALRPPVHILVVAFAPEERPLGLAAETRSIQAAWEEHEGVTVTVLERPTVRDLRRRLLSRRFQILHFMGHGDFDRETGEGTLLLASAQASPARVPATTLARQLRETGLRLIVLNACDGARVSNRQGHDPFAAVATALVAGGVGAVVAMQFPISDPAACAFSETFYRQLAAGDLVEEAVTEGRLAIDAEDPGTLEWSTPALYMRSSGALHIASGARPQTAAANASREDVDTTWMGRQGLAPLASGSRPALWWLCIRCTFAQALTWTSVIALSVVAPSTMRGGLQEPLALAVTAVAAVAFPAGLYWGFFRLGTKLRQRSRSLTWAISAVAALIGVSLWFLILWFLSRC